LSNIITKPVFECRTWCELINSVRRPFMIWGLSQPVRNLISNNSETGDNIAAIVDNYPSCSMFQNIPVYKPEKLNMKPKSLLIGSNVHHKEIFWQAYELFGSHVDYFLIDYSFEVINDEIQIVRMLHHKKNNLEAQSDTLTYYNTKGLERDKHLFFILGMPRSGTKWFSHFFSTDQVHCFHELTATCHGNVADHMEAMSRFKMLHKQYSIERSMHYLLYYYPSLIQRMFHKLYETEAIVACGNSDCAQRDMSMALYHMFYSSRFLIVLRNGFDVGLSLEAMMQMENQQRYIEKYAKMMKLQGYSPPMTLFDIACWRWVNGTKKLLDMTRKFNRRRCKLVNFEKIFCNIEYVRSIWDFIVCGKALFESDRSNKLLSVKINKGTYIKPVGRTIKERWATLDSERKMSFDKIAGEFMSNLPGYEGWPDIDF